MYRDNSIGVVIAASGKGRRMGTELPKQFLPVNGVPCLRRAADIFRDMGIFDEMVVAAPEEYLGTATEMLEDVTIIAGGASRADSVRRALEHISSRYVLVHDGARPYADRNLVMRVVDSAVNRGSTVPGVKPRDTVRTEERVLDRENLFLVQTPQGFLTEELKAAYEAATANGFEGTDDASYAEAAGGKIYIVPGDPGNIKITVKEDLPVETRTGHGLDVHRLVPGRKLVLGGVEIPWEKGLLGHSDADVLVHAVIDALLGGACLGDIGQMFPDSDPRYEGISSLVLLEETGRRLRENRYGVSAIDATLICQAPKIAPYIPEMRRNIAGALGIGADRVSVKGTTAEGLGPIGRGEGMACEAVCILQKQET